MWIQIFGVVLGLIVLCQTAATPINNYLYPIKAKIIVEERKVINFTPQPIKEPLKVEKYPEIREFLNNLPNCDWCVACGSYAHYTRLEAEKQGIKIGEITITDPDRNRVQRLVMDGHRINYFYANDEHRVYIDNMYNWGLILEFNDLHDHIKTKFGFDLSRIGFKNTKLFKI